MLNKRVLLKIINLQLKFGLSEKHTKFDKIFLMVLTNQLIYLAGNVKTIRKILSIFVAFLDNMHFDLKNDVQNLKSSLGDL